MSDTVRIDKWLWAIRIYKTRSLAAKHCSAGKVKRDGKSLKPSSTVKVGDKVEVPVADGSHKRLLELVQPLDTRVSAPLAETAYRDLTPKDVLDEAARRRADKRAAREVRQEGDQGRLTKKQRRAWESQIHGFNDQ